MNTQGAPSEDPTGDPSSPRPAEVPSEAEADPSLGAGSDPRPGSRGEEVILPPPAYPGRGAVYDAPVRPPDPILPYVAPPVPRRRRSDWPVLVFALVVAALVMAGCCIAGFAVYVRNGGIFD